MIEKLQQNMIELFNDPEITTEQLAFFENKIWENRSQLESKFLKSFLLFIAVSVTWLMIKSTSIEKFSVFGMEFEEFNILLLILPPIAAFLYYQFFLCIGINEIINSTLKACYSQMLPFFEKNSLNDLLFVSSLLYLEGTLFNISEYGSFWEKVNMISLYSIQLIILFSPIPILMWMLYSLFISHSIGILWSILSSLLVIAFVIRSLFIFFYINSLETLCKKNKIC